MLKLMDKKILTIYAQIYCLPGGMYMLALILSLKTRNLQTDTLANSEYPDKMPHKGAFHQHLHCLLRQNRPSEKGYNTS